VTDLLGLVNRALPEPKEGGSSRRTGGDLPISHPVLTALGERAAAANNEMNAHARIMAGFQTKDGNGNGNETRSSSDDNESDRQR
jgi:hypothetical protein